MQRSLEQKAGIRGLRPQLLRVFDDQTRDTRGWVLSAAHVDVVPIERIDSSSAHLLPVRELRDLPFDHDRIVQMAVETLRAEYDRTADPRDLLGGSFTLRDLQSLHEAVAGEELRRETFRKRMSDR